MTEETRRKLRGMAGGWFPISIEQADRLLQEFELAYELGEKAGRSEKPGTGPGLNLLQVSKLTKDKQ